MRYLPKSAFLLFVTLLLSAGGWGISSQYASLLTGAYLVEDTSFERSAIRMGLHHDNPDWQEQLDLSTRLTGTISEKAPRVFADFLVASRNKTDATKPGYVDITRYRVVLQAQGDEQFRHAATLRLSTNEGSASREIAQGSLAAFAEPGIVANPVPIPHQLPQNGRGLSVKAELILTDPVQIAALHRKDITDLMILFIPEGEAA